MALSVCADVEHTAAGEGDDHLLEAVVWGTQPNLDLADAGLLFVDFEKGTPISADEGTASVINWDDLLVLLGDVGSIELKWG